MKLQPLPPLNSLVAFEAAARHLSFTVAARELNVTQGAISRQIRLLEDYLGTALFTRTTREINLTVSGSQYYESIRDTLQQIAQATAGMRHWQGAQQVTVVTSTAMASLWLLPLVSEFQRQNEEIDLRIIATDQVSDFSRLDCDLALYYCSTPPKNMKVTPLFNEEIFPVCSPAYLTQHPGIETLEQLGGCTWLWLEDQHRDWIGWKEWFQRLGYQAPEPRRRININSYSMLIQSALAGQGIALAWSGLLSNHLQTGNLVRPTQAILRTDAQFCLLEPQGRAPNRQSVNRFRQWLMAHLAETDDV
ncbi:MULTISPECIES: LysR substrate-binding domain-containing protein [Pseudomonas]|uniref:LysR substrate-binding domain-containing protein n=1 Tax=Pseudomonas TaxID=286 RepID=UPI0007096A53|nr:MULTISPECIES: LysR substrate-binding domain-containing protein [Pseudomonas]KQW30700.1 LysR family transcriptional regulator [Pseudomonas sp. Root401]WHS55681.1 LysR substrate-binding domain-containing protein [Pseudomonas brassicacearum]